MFNGIKKNYKSKASILPDEMSRRTSCQRGAPLTTRAVMSPRCPITTEK